jgi:hypothetical protein
VTIIEALRGLVGNPKLIAVLPPGPPDQPALTMTPGNRILDVRNGKPRDYTPKFSDYMSIQWELVDMTVPRQPRQGA